MLRLLVLTRSSSSKLHTAHAPSVSTDTVFFIEATCRVNSNVVGMAAIHVNTLSILCFTCMAWHGMAVDAHVPGIVQPQQSQTLENAVHGMAVDAYFLEVCSHNSPKQCLSAPTVTIAQNAVCGMAVRCPFPGHKRFLSKTVCGNFYLLIQSNG